MAQDIAELGFKVDSDQTVTATRRLDKMARSTSTAETRMDQLTRTAQRVRQILPRALIAGGAAMAAITANSVRLAVAAEETASKFNVVFAGSVDRTNRALRELQKTIPLTTSEMQAFASMAQDMLVPLGIARDQAADMSVEIVRLAGDISAFNNTDVDQVLQNIQSALAGEAQVLRKYGIAMNEARLQQVAFEEGITSTERQLTFQERAMAAVEIITRDTADAAGFAAAELDSAAGMMRMFSRDIRQAQEDLGTALLPTLVEFGRWLNETPEDGLTRFQEGIRQTMQVLMTLISAFVIVKESALLFGEVLVGLGMASYHAARAMVDPFIEANTALAESFEALWRGDFGGAADAFLGIGERMAAAWSDAIANVDTSLDFIGESFEDRVSGALDTVGDLMTRFSKENAAAAKQAEDLGKRTQLTWNKVSDSVSKALKESMRYVEALQQRNYENTLSELESSFDFVEGLEDQAEAAEQLMLQLDPAAAAAQRLAEGMELLEFARDNLDLAPEDFEKMTDALERMTGAAVNLGDSMQAWGGAFEDVIRSLQLGTERGTDEYKALEVAVQAANIVQAIGAVLAQGQGDPYTAPARMAAMASIVSALTGAAISIGSMGGGIEDPTAARQAALGTGGVLGDPNQATESIVNSLKIIEEATEQLPGLNRELLNAMRSLSDAITGATTVLARGLSNISFDPISQPGGLGGFFGGMASVVDEGISVEGGLLADVIEGMLVRGFQDVTERKHFFDDFDTSRNFRDLDEAVGREFGRVLMSIADTVRAAAGVLGFTSDEIEEVLANFNVWSQDISFEGMGVEEQRQALEAYFGAIFDSMAHEVVPFLTDIQQVGEGMGEALVRAATSVQLFDYAVEQLGFQFSVTADMFDSLGDFRYRAVLTKIALVEAAGGMDQFIEGLNNFIDAFASDDQKAQMQLDAITMRFDELGLALPDSRDGIWELMQSLDAATESGRAGIAMLLEITPMLDSYYEAIEEGEQERLRMAEQVRDFIGVPGSQLTGLTMSFKQAMDAAQGLNASQQEYAMIVRSFSMQLDRLTAELTRSLLQQTQALFGEAAAQTATDFEDEFDGVRRVSNSLFGEWQRALSNLLGFADGLLLNENLTTLSPAQRLAEAQSQFQDTLRRAQGGDVDAAGDLPGIAQEFLEIARFMFASGGQYQTIFRDVQTALRGVETPPGIEEWTYEIVENTARTATLTAEVTQQQNEMIAQLDRLIAAMDLSNTLGELAFTLGQSPVEIADRLGVPLDHLADALGVDITQASSETLDGIINMAQRLGADIFALSDTLGVDIQSLADQFGVDLAALDFSGQFDRELDLLTSILDISTYSSTLLEMIANVDTRIADGLFGPGLGDPGGPMAPEPEAADPGISRPGAPGSPNPTAPVQPGLLEPVAGPGGPGGGPGGPTNPVEDLVDATLAQTLQMQRDSEEMKEELRLMRDQLRRQAQ